MTSIEFSLKCTDKKALLARHARMLRLLVIRSALICLEVDVTEIRTINMYTARYTQCLAAIYTELLYSIVWIGSTDVLIFCYGTLAADKQ